MLTLHMWRLPTTPGAPGASFAGTGALLLQPEVSLTLLLTLFLLIQSALPLAAGQHLSSPAILPNAWAADRLLVDHASRLFDLGAAGVVFRAGEIEAWGSRIQRIMEVCRSAGAPESLRQPRPFANSDMTVEFRFAQDDLEALAGKPAEPGTTQTTTKATTQEATQEATQETTEETTQERIVAHLQASPRATRVLLAQWLG